MKKLTTQIFLSFIFIFLTFNSCKKDDSGTSNTSGTVTNTTLTGKWYHVLNLVDTLSLSLKMDGHYVFYTGADSIYGIESGYCANSPTTLFFYAETGRYCENKVGIYSYGISGTHMTLVLVLDSCTSSGRADAIKGKW